MSVMILDAGNSIIKPGGQVDYSLARSVPIGTQNVVVDFEESFRANNLQAVKDTPNKRHPVTMG